MNKNDFLERMERELNNYDCPNKYKVLADYDDKLTKFYESKEAGELISKLNSPEKEVAKICEKLGYEKKVKEDSQFSESLFSRFKKTVVGPTNEQEYKESLKEEINSNESFDKTVEEEPIIEEVEVEEPKVEEEPIIEEVEVEEEPIIEEVEIEEPIIEEYTVEEAMIEDEKNHVEELETMDGIQESIIETDIINDDVNYVQPYRLLYLILIGIIAIGLFLLAFYVFAGFLFFSYIQKQIIDLYFYGFMLFSSLTGIFVLSIINSIKKCCKEKMMGEKNE